MKYVIKIRHENYWNKLAGGTGVEWRTFGQPQKSLYDAIVYAVNACFIFNEQFIVSWED